MALEWYGDECKARLRATLAGQLQAAAGVLVEAEQAALNRPYPPASVASEHPARRSGNLRRSTVAVPDSVPETARTLRVTVGYLKRAGYVSRLVETGRHWLLHTLRRVRPRLAAAFGGVKVGGE